MLKRAVISVKSKDSIEGSMHVAYSVIAVLYPAEKMRSGKCVSALRDSVKSHKYRVSSDFKRHFQIWTRYRRVRHWKWTGSSCDSQATRGRSTWTCCIYKIHATKGILRGSRMSCLVRSQITCVTTPRFFYFNRKKELRGGWEKEGRNWHRSCDYRSETNATNRKYLIRSQMWVNVDTRRYPIRDCASSALFSRNFKVKELNPFD